MDRIHYHISIQLDGSTNESINQLRKYSKRNNRYSCKEARGYSRQCVHQNCSNQ